MTALNDATVAQIKAADPLKSTWLSANAGSGKTRVLTDRVARLLLQGVRPENILCLTYTKAAASEMQNRLFKRLGRWTMLPPDELRAELLELGITDIPDDLNAPRTLFATAIETPGGLKIQTIHSFCASLLRQFPLEAGISPQFTELDDRDQKLLLKQVLETLCDVPGPSVFDGLAAEMATGDLDKFLMGLLNHADLFKAERGADAIWTSLGLRPGQDKASIVADCFLPSDFGLLERLTADLSALSNEKSNSGKLTALPRTMDQNTFDGLVKLWLVKAPKDGLPYSAKLGAFPTKATRPKIEYLNEVEDFMKRVETTQQRLFLHNVAQRTHALEVFAVPFLRAYNMQKSLRGHLDFNDLILKTRDLLEFSSVRNWVLYKLDGGLEHVLIDEAQDTSPTQWSVIENLTEEMTSGEGSGAEDRTIFVVGDKKQSIYSFQGADPAEFDRMKKKFADKLTAVGKELKERELQYSFRSSNAILTVVDQVFEGQNGLGGASNHLAFKSQMPGRVDAWAFVDPSGSTDDAHWADPVDLKSENHHDTILANNIACELKKMLEHGLLPEGDGGRKIQPRDILILVRSRQAGLFSELHRACKSAELSVSGYDRLTIGEELAVKDLRALIEFLVTPEDSYALACVLKSPLFGWTEQNLFTLSAGKRSKYLWRALDQRRAEFPETVSILRDLRQKAEFFRPYELLEYVLSDLKGRQKLIGRLGREAEEAIDAFSTLALEFERAQVPSLTGFLVWLDIDDLQVKRQLDGSHNEIRIMTIHGSKGLEAPIVILPQTGPQPAPRQNQIVEDEDGNPLWLPSRQDLPNAMRGMDTESTQKGFDERDRLLYVAMTRAESWLIVAASGKRPKDDPNDHWYKSVTNTLKNWGAVEYESPTGPGLRYQSLDWPLVATVPIKADETPPTAITVPTAAAPKPIPALDPLNPSKLPGAKTLPGDLDGSPDALDYGTAVHALLEHLPDLPADQWMDAAVTLAGADHDRALAEASAVLTHPDFAHLFAPGSLAEVQVAGHFGQNRPVLGTIDRLMITENNILIVDYKTNRVVPENPQDTPIGVLRQLDTYAQAMQAIYPNHMIETAILWTHLPKLMTVPHHIVRGVSD